MIKRFRNYSVSNIAVLVIIAFLMRISAWLSPSDFVSFSIFEPFAKLMLKNDFLGQISYPQNVFLAILVVLSQAFFINHVINNHILFGKPNLLPALCYVIVSSIFPQFLVLSTPLLNNFLLIWIFAKIIKISKAESPVATMYDIGLIVAVGTFLYFPFIFMFLTALLGLLLFRPFNWREWFASILGFATVYLFVAVFYYWNNRFELFLEIFKPFGNKISNTFHLQPNDYLPLAPLAILFLGGLWLLRQNFYNHFVTTRKTFQWLFCTFLITVASFYLKTKNPIAHSVLALPSVSVFVAYFFNFSKPRWLYESLFWLFIISIQYFHFI